MTIARFVPFRSGLNDVAILQNRLNSLFQEFSSTDNGTESLAAGNFIPAVDVYEDAQKLVLKLEVPGIRREDLDVRVEGRTLTVKGERTFEAHEKEENFHRLERRYGSFVRSFTLPGNINAEEIDATCSDGVLSIALARKPEATPKQVKVKIGGGSSNESKQIDANTPVMAA